MPEIDINDIFQYSHCFFFKNNPIGFFQQELFDYLFGSEATDQFIIDVIPYTGFLMNRNC